MTARPERHRGFLAAPRGILKIRNFSPLSGSQAAMSATGWLFVNVRHSGRKDAHGVTLVSAIHGEGVSALLTRMVGGFSFTRWLSDALFGARQKVIRRASEDVSHLLKAIRWDGGTALVQTQARLTTA